MPGDPQWTGQLSGAGWSDDERLVLVDSAGQVSIYDMFGKMERSLSLGQVSLLPPSDLFFI